MRETVFWRVFHLQQTKENVSHVKITKEKRKADRKEKSRQLLHRTSYLPLPQIEKEMRMSDKKDPEKDFEKKTSKKIEKEPEKKNPPPKGKSPKLKKKSGRGKPAFLFLLLIVLALIGAGVYLLIPSKNRISHNEYFGIEDDSQYGLIVNSEIADTTDGAPFEENGVWYLPFSTLYYQVSDAFYYDGLALLYTGPLQTYSATPGESHYTDSDGIKYTLSYQPCYFKDGGLCVELDYLQLMEYSYYTVDDTKLVL